MAPRVLGPPEIPGRCRRSYPARTVADVDRGLVWLRGWLAEQLRRAPEFGFEYYHRYRKDLDALLDARNRLMRP